MVEFEPRLFEDIPPKDRPSLVESVVPIVGMIASLSVGIVGFGLGPQFPLLWGIAFTGLFAWYQLDCSWEDLYDGISDSLLMGMRAILIIFLAYTLVSTLIQAGTIPTLMYYGVEILTPKVFLPVTAILVATITLAIGSSWTAVGALGVAFIGIGSGLGIPAPMTAGAILTGAYTGDKMSPLSDTTNLAAAVTDTDLYDHIRAMRPGSTLALGISLVLYTVLGLSVSGSIPDGRIAAIQTAIETSYVVTPLVFVPLLLILGLAMYGIPAIPTLGAGIFASALISIQIQGVPFATAWDAAVYGTGPTTGMELVNGLLESGGMVDASWAITIVIAALSLGGMFERTGILAVLAHHLARLCRGAGSTTGVTAFSALSMNVLAAEQYISIVVPGMSLRNLYNEQGLKSQNLSRAVEAAGTTTSALVPWTSGAVFMSGVLGVPTMQYAPYYFFGFLSPLILLVMGATGWQIMYTDQHKSVSTTSAEDATVPVASED
ncbi:MULTISPECIES: Na+/H+ antiporter NhaC family protein [Haloferacaceae]|uniref:Na+/H+ antiporter NhaC family protein n=1 Tax=Halorubrum glutamatedens TaxID=2707018 RepID=A0ABD5QRJ5_9EURY|nr:Na+/H+ antiporter NhaC family protein [Halobellus captivus]